MKKGIMIGWVIGIPVLVIVLILIIIFHEPAGEGIPRAMAAKSVALAVQSPKELVKWQEGYGASHYPAKLLDEWYVPYMDYLYEEGFLTEEVTPATEKAAQGQLTYGEAAQIAGRISPELKERVRMTKKNKDKPYPQEQWWLFYDAFLKEADPEGQVKKTSLLVYGTPDNVHAAPAWTAYTNLGTVRFSGLALDPYIDHELTAYVRETEILHILEDKGDEVTYRNVWLTDGDEDGLTVYVGDITRELPFKKTSKKTADILGNLADIQLEGGKVTKVSVKKERITGKVLSVNEDAIEIEGYGAVPLDDECKVLKTYGGLQRQKLSDILVGYDMQEFVVAKGKVCAALTVRAFDADSIRVLIMDTGFKNLEHESVTLYCDGPLLLKQGDEKTEIAAGEELVFASGDERLATGRMILEPQNGHELAIRSVERTQGVPLYAGRLELVQGEHGIVVINDIYMEDYLKKVVPSEMPTSYEKEALKAQAVCARTYAYMQIQSNTYSQYGAQVDDSTNFQVYNNVATDERTAAAVQETYGKLLLYEGRPIEAYYFSTSCGTTTNSSVWGSDPEKTPYLKSRALQPGGKRLDLESDKAFSAFIKNQDITAYDSSFPFYRWNVTTNTEILTENIGGVGVVESISITERLPGGVARTMLVKGSEGEKTIVGQNAIRAALGDGRLSIKRKDGKTSEGWSSLPSGFLTIEDAGVSESGVRSFKIFGGGYGHGVGMSQNGAQGMAKSGMGYEEILKFFYDGAEVAEISSQPNE